MPTFAPAAPVGSGLDLLAAAALTPNPGALPRVGPVAHPLHEQGPYNPIALVSTRVAKRIMDLEFVEMAEIVAEDDFQATRSITSSRPPITNISQWVERFSIMAAVLTLRYPEKAPEFLAYQALIVRSERNYEGHQWVIYDRQFRREALAREDLNWSVLDSRLYNEAFTGRARAIPRCPHCLCDDHTASACPRNPTGAIAVTAPSTSTQYPVQGTQICRNYYEGRCRKPQCRYQHLCLSCNESHPYMSCPRRRLPAKLPRARSPGRRRGPGLH